MSGMKKIFWRFYWCLDFELSHSIHFANTDQMWRKLIHRLYFETDRGHKYISVKAKVL